MVEPQDRDAAVFKRSADCVPNDGGAQMTHVHLFGDIWGGEVDDGPLVCEAWSPAFHPLPKPQISDFGSCTL